MQSIGYEMKHVDQIRSRQLRKHRWEEGFDSELGFAKEQFRASKYLWRSPALIELEAAPPPPPPLLLCWVLGLGHGNSNKLESLHCIEHSPFLVRLN